MNDNCCVDCLEYPCQCETDYSYLDRQIVLEYAADEDAKARKRAAVLLGRRGGLKGGKSKSAKKQAAARENGAKNRGKGKT